MTALASEFKQKFLENNEAFAELKPSAESTTIGEFHEIDPQNDEVWFMQCPKGLELTTLEGQKMKLPGRSCVGDLEAVAVELTTASDDTTEAEVHAFGYCNNKGRYALRLLPVRGSIVLRSRLKANDSLTTEQIEASVPVAGRVPVPAGIKVRHPLLGLQYAEKLCINKTIADRLSRADEVSLQVSRETRQNMLRKTSTFDNGNKNPRKITQKNKTTVIESIIDASDDDVEFVSKTILKKKRKISEETSTKSKKSKKTKKIDAEDVSTDLQWLKEL